MAALWASMAAWIGSGTRSAPPADTGNGSAIPMAAPPAATTAAWARKPRRDGSTMLFADVFGFPSGWLRLGLSRCYEHGGGPLVFQVRIAHCINMKEAIRKTVGGKRRGPGRPATGAAPSRTFRLTDEFIASLDAWAANQVDKPSRSEAIRRLVELGLKAK